MLEDLLRRRPYNAVTDLIDAPVERGLAGKTAFIDADRTLTYSDLQARSCRFASALLDIGLRPEERLALLLYDTVDFPVAFLGGVRAGIVALPLNTLLNAEQYAYILADSRASAIVASASLAKTLLPILDRLPRLRTIILIGDSADDRAAFAAAGRDVHDFTELLARTFAGEWTFTGDKYFRDNGGYYHYCGRTDDMFKVSGMWVSPFEVEAALASHEAVLEAAVIGKQDADGLIKPKAFIVLRNGFAADERLLENLRVHVKNCAGPWKYPRWIDIRPDLPRTATGKIQRFKLRELES